MPNTTDLREQSRVCLQAAMAKPSRLARHKLARRALELARLAAKLERGMSLTEDEKALVEIGMRVLV